MEPVAAVRALHRTMLLTYWLLSFTDALVSCFVILLAKAPPVFWALHLALYLDKTGLLLITLL